MGQGQSKNSARQRATAQAKKLSGTRFLPNCSHASQKEIDAIAADDTLRVPTLIEFSPPCDHFSEIVAIQGNFYGSCTRIPMNRSDSGYHIVLNLNPGTYHYNFVVDNALVVVDAEANTAVVDDVSYNMITVQDANSSLLSLAPGEGFVSPLLDFDSSDWGHERHVFEESKRYPPFLPPHFKTTPLFVFNQGVGDLSETFRGTEPALITSRPHPVTIGHIYFSERDRCTIIGITTRIKNKYCTIRYHLNSRMGQKRSAEKNEEDRDNHDNFAVINSSTKAGEDPLSSDLDVNGKAHEIFT